MSGGSSQDKTEQPTSKKQNDARRKGQVAQSREIPSVVVLLSAMTVFFFGGAWMFNHLGEIMQMVLSRLYQQNFSIETAHLFLWEIFQRIVLVLAPLLSAVIVAGILSNVSQTGFLLSGEVLTPKFNKLNPISGIKRLFSLRSTVEVVKAIIKVTIIGSMAYAMLRKDMEEIPALVFLSVPDILAFFGKAAFNLGLYTCVVLILLAAIDLFFQRWQHDRDLRMTKQEVKDERRQSEGDPLVRSRIRAVQREMAMKRMMDSVPDATVVITNPTHLAVALKFERDMQAPKVVAKGAGLIAERIKAIANENDVPVIEQKPLARALFKSVEIDQYIPGDLYHAVAEILAYVYRLKGLAQ
ncbi:MAG: flagellar biosynthesis protein FlhB [Desulfobacteraceae bacterium]|jgi:flagellar biosynthetic protein FlhB